MDPSDGMGTTTGASVGSSNHLTTSNATIQLTGLAHGSTYEVTVQARVHREGWGTPSEPATVRTNDHCSSDDDDVKNLKASAPSGLQTYDRRQGRGATAILHVGLAAGCAFAIFLACSMCVGRNLWPWRVAFGYSRIVPPPALSSRVRDAAGPTGSASRGRAPP